MYVCHIDIVNNSVAIYDSNKWIFFKLSNIKESEVPEVRIRCRNAMLRFIGNVKSILVCYSMVAAAYSLSIRNLWYPAHSTGPLKERHCSLDQWLPTCGLQTLRAGGGGWGGTVLFQGPQIFT
jgi:hypothetical protein